MGLYQADLLSYRGLKCVLLTRTSKLEMKDIMNNNSGSLKKV